jgi:hypothetical protein
MLPKLKTVLLCDTGPFGAALEMVDAILAFLAVHFTTVITECANSTFRAKVLFTKVT